MEAWRGEGPLRRDVARSSDGLRRRIRRGDLISRSLPDMLRCVMGLRSW